MHYRRLAANLRHRDGVDINGLGDIQASLSADYLYPKLKKDL